jgi:heme/copper-type cytochrome/quinol oxidase subunit 1
MFIKNNFIENKFFLINKKNNLLSFNFVDFFKSLLNILFWGKVRILYYVNNWIYTTNHKRIAVNYFWFVILSGIVGMVLATLIRLEFAYPGVGVFAGDSLQYLSMATAHGVIMVFFMIMPLLFGAFANFLIPTQLGVHDVAFPRLNSAAFWFLPGGLLMLCQLVCVDRRYQRMNCFNIREIQSILKRKFFTDLINTHDHHTLLNKSAMGLRFKTDNVNSLNSNAFIFYNYGIEFAPKIRNSNYLTSVDNFNNLNLVNSNSIFYNLINFFNFSNFFSFFNNIFFFFISNLNNANLFCFNFKNLINSIVFYVYYTYDFNVYLIYLTVDSFNNTLSFISDFFKNFDSFFIIFIIIPVTDFIIFSMEGLNNYLYYFNLNFSSIFSFKISFPNYFFDFNFSISNFFYDFFFFFRFFEIFYLYNTSSSFNFSFYINYLNLPSFFNNIFYFLKLSPFSEISTKINYLNNKNLTSFNDNFDNVDLTYVKNTKPYFNDSFVSKIDYNSYFVYIHVFFYMIFNLPYFIINFFSNIFNFNLILNTFSNFYQFFMSWYIPALLSDNVFYFFYKNINSINPLFSYKNLSETVNSFFNNFSNLYSILFINHKSNFLYSFFNFVHSFLFEISNNFLSFFNNFFSLSLLILFSNKTNFIFSFIYNFNFYNYFRISDNTISSLNYSYKSNYFNNSSLSFSNTYTNEENSNTQRYLRFYNPIFKYDYKSGDYFPKFYKEVYTSLFTTIAELTSSIRTAPWFISDKYMEAFNTNFSIFSDNVINVNNFNKINFHSWSGSRFTNTDAFYNFFYTLSNDFVYTNKKWIALNTLNQKFYRMFNTSSMQQRIYTNWRQLKFTREAWRCKLLAARHQKTLFRRYVHEDGVFWSIERNAKDLLPGWAMITPFSSRTRFTAVGKTDIGLMGVFLVLNSSIISGANFLVTYRYLSTLNNRKMRDARVFFTESIIVACWMMIFANPMLVIAIIMLLSDRHWQTSFFDYSGGGDTVLFQHMFWFFGHPEVYVIIIPTFGFVNSMISYYLRKRVSARASLMYSMYTIAFLGFFVWGHHMYMVGLAHTTRMLFSTLTVMISVPAATKIMHWCVTTVNSAIAMELPLLFTFTFIFLFVSGGISGMCVAHTGMDVLFHDTFYVIGHFHVMLAGSAMFSSFGAFYFYFPAIFGVKYSRIYAYLHYVYYLLGQLMTVIPMFWLGYAGMPRRVLDYPASMGGWHSVISAGHMLSVAGLMAFFIMIFDSLRQGRAVTRNTFGISRYNTRLNFYLYEIARLTHLQQKGLVLFRFVKPTSIKLNDMNYFNFEPLETTLISYTFYKK